QYSGDATDARTDQFGFAVALFEALFGARPFDGGSLEEVFANVSAGRVRATSRKVPLPIRRAVLRALRKNPNERFPSMDAMLDALASAPRTRAPRAARVLVPGALAATTIGFALRPKPAPAALCTGAERKLDGVWDAARKEAALAAFTKTEKPFAKSAF